MLLGVGVGLAIHLIVTCAVTNKPLNHASECEKLNYFTALQDSCPPWKE